MFLLLYWTWPTTSVHSSQHGMDSSHVSWGEELLLSVDYCFFHLRLHQQKQKYANLLCSKPCRTTFSCRLYFWLIASFTSENLDPSICYPWGFMRNFSFSVSLSTGRGAAKFHHNYHFDTSSNKKWCKNLWLSDSISHPQKHIQLFFLNLLSCL